MYADVIVDISAEKLDKTFQYGIPQELMDDIFIGVQVVVPFGNRKEGMTGFVVGISEEPKIDPGLIKDICRVLKDSFPVESELIALAAYMRQYFGGTMNQAIKTVIPVKKIEKHKVSKLVRLNMTADEAASFEEECRRKGHVARQRLISELRKRDYIEYELLTTKLNLSSAVIKAMEEKGYITVEKKIDFRNNLPVSRNTWDKVALNDEQKAVVEAIEASRDKAHLIHGVTGSGKTEVYIELIKRAVSRGQKAIVLIPEIALTFQTVSRFYDHFGDRVSVIHSKLSKGEKYDRFECAKEGLLDVMIGPRSALFTPFKDIGYIIIDEEHETSYKSETVPRYNARDVALKRAQMCGATVVLGSATPSVDTYYMAKTGRLMLHTLANRVSDRPLPVCRVVDLREELRRGNRSVFSEELYKAMADRLSRHEQIMLFINRRGIAGFVSCRSCGEVVKCPHCDVSLSLHADGKMKCHYCGYEQEQVTECPACSSKLIGTFKTGTEKVEKLVQDAFPGVKTLRMDYDSTRKKGSYEEILSAFAAHEADVLIGTQMIVKGHDFKDVTLMGILAADMSLNVSDYTAGERTFSLITQAAGRAGRGEKPGEVIIQTYRPESFAIQTAKDQDYLSFYGKEIEFRDIMGYPPVRRLLLIFMTSSDESRCEALAVGVAGFVRSLAVGDGRIYGSEPVAVIGPSTAPVYKINDIYRRQLYVKADTADTLADIAGRVQEFLKTCEHYTGSSVVFDMS
ncbi:MAG: primosomal protein N' [Lachnospiraceae bacterium]|nr:primosomal protein N' [Lachnospiraceae bacterium]